MSLLAPGLNVTVVVSAVAAVVAAPRVLRGPTPERPAAAGASAPRATPGPATDRRVFGPGAALAAVVALIYLNQLLFAVYVLRVHGGDTSFVARYLPPGWFATADGGLVRRLAAHMPVPELLAPSVLRVQAFLELPFVLLAFATVLRWLDAGLYRRVARSALVPLAAASYTAAFCLVEWDLRNPYTVDDIALRVLSALVTPVLIRVLAGRERGPLRPVSARGLLLFGVSLWALGSLVLVVYDTALLYNLSRLGGRLPDAALALAVLAGARYAASYGRAGAPAGPAVATVAAGLGRALVLFLVPALAIRYGGSFAGPALAAGAGLLVVLRAAAGARGERAGAGAWIGLAAALPAAAAAGWAAARWTTDAYYEAGLLRAATAFLLTVIGVCALADAGADALRKQADSPP
ncbi:hypothetical protein [Kitasatospora sp. NBC_00315]|uniref:hypothetical protein n=1 Tax=Kitasatospora sp. NBC_00315 TaxID=2975963 RepID=UPI00325609BD